MARQTKKENLNVKVDYETLLKGSKVLLKEKSADIVLRSMAGIEKAMPEIKAVGRNMIMHAGVALTKAAAESIVGNSEGLDKVAEVVHTGIAVNTAYNTVVGVHSFNKGYKKATNKSIQEMLKKYEDAAERYEDADDEAAF